MADRGETSGAIAARANQTSDTPKGVVTSQDIRKAEEQFPSAEPMPEHEGQDREASALGQGGFGAMDDHSGSYSYRIPVHVPKPRNAGPSPKVFLTCNSMSSKSPSLVGAGWRLELGRITRAAKKGSSVDFRNNQGDESARDHFILELDGQSYTLVSVANDADSFRVKIEKQCAVVNRILSTTEKDVSGDAVIDCWEAFLADGTRYLFGRPESTGSSGELRNKVWNILQIEKPNGQRVLYEYDLYFNANNPAYQEQAYSYPVRIKCGVDADGSWDSEIVFEYTAADVPDEEEGYYNLTSRYTGRPPSTCILWRRLVGIRSLIRKADGTLQTCRELKIGASHDAAARVFVVHKVEEIPYRNGKADKTAVLPPHAFEYIFKGESNPALISRTTTPMGKVEEVVYGLATELDREAKAMDGVYLVRQYTEKAGSESWTKEYEYLGGEVYAHFDEYRGHRRVTVTDKESNLRTVSSFEQNGIHNGRLQSRKSFDAEGRLVSHEENEWMALVYGAGRYLPFAQRHIVRNYAEDGRTILSTVVREIPEAENANVWKYAIDEFGNVLTETTTTYAGDIRPENVVLAEKTVTVYENRTTGAKRFIGLPIDVQKFARTSARAPWRLSARTRKRFNENGQVEEELTHLDRGDTRKVLRKTFLYHPPTGQLTFRYRHDGGKQLLEEACEYYEDGPFRFLLRRRLNARRQAVEFVQYDPETRECTAELDVSGMLLNRAYDGMGRLTEEIYSGDRNVREGEKNSHRYTYTIAPAERSVESLQIHTGTREKKFYDALERITRVVRTGYKGRRIVVQQVEFDHKTRKPASVSEPHYEGDQPPAFTRTFYEDARLRRTREVDPAGKITRLFYDGLTETVEEDTRLVEEVRRDAAGQVIRRARGARGDAGRYEVTYEYDEKQRLIRTRDHQGTILQTIDYGSRLDDKRVAVKDVSKGETTMEYDGFGRLKTSRRSGLVSQFTHDELDRVVEQTDSAGTGSRTVKTEYDTAPHGIGRMAMQSSLERTAGGTCFHSRTFTYDAFGFPAAVEDEWDVQWKEPEVSRKYAVRTEYVYNGAKGGRLELVSHATMEGMPARRIVYSYDDVSGQLTGIRLDDTPVWQIGPEGFTARNQPSAVLLGDRMTSRFEYDKATGLPTSSTVLRGSDMLVRHQLQYDTSRRIRLRNSVTPTRGEDGAETAVERTVSFDYDAKSQLVSCTENGATQRFAYAPNGCRTSSDDNGQKVSCTYDPASPHRLVSLSGARQHTFTWDEAGNLLSDRDGDSELTRRFQWNASNRAAGAEFHDPAGNVVAIQRYWYGGDGERAAMFDTGDDGLVLYAGPVLQIKFLLAARQTVVQTHVMNGARRVATLVQHTEEGERLHYYHRDHLETVSVITDRNGAVLDSTFCDPFGRVTPLKPALFSDILFTGHRADKVTFQGFSHYDFRARLYDPDLGVFLSPDEKDDEKSVSFGQNRYTYVSNDPVNKLDPSGFEEFEHGWDYSPVNLLGFGVRKAGDFLERNVPLVGPVIGNPLQAGGNFVQGTHNLITLDFNDAGTDYLEGLRDVGTTGLEAMGLPNTTLGWLTAPVTGLSHGGSLGTYEYENILGDKSTAWTLETDTPYVYGTGTWGFSLGSFLTVRSSAGMSAADFSDLTAHEAGHTKQSQVLGPTYLPFVLGSYAIEKGLAGASHQQSTLEKWAEAWK